MTTPRDLEDQLREHYAAKASELRLPPAELDGVLARGDVPVVARVGRTATARRGWIAGAVAAALVGGAVVGAGVVLVTDDDPGPASRPIVLPQTEPPVDPGGAPGFCETAEIPDDVAELGLVDDVRIPGILLPTDTPADHCAADHMVTTTPVLGYYTVWSSCADCGAPTAVIARLHTESKEYLEGDLPHDSVEVGDHAGRLYEPSDDVPVTRLYVDAGDVGTVTFVGWGLEQSALFEVAAAAVAQPLDEPGDIGDMTMVFNGALGPYFPASLPVPSTLDVFYVRHDGMGLGYHVVRSEMTTAPFMPPLEAYSWAFPNAMFATVGGRRTLSFPASDWYGNRQQSAVIIQIDDATQIAWTSTGETPTPADELAAIEVTPAPVDDPRWLEIAWESGQYDALG